jgi:hypothetical protein
VLSATVAVQIGCCFAISNELYPLYNGNIYIYVCIHPYNCILIYIDIYNGNNVAWCAALTAMICYHPHILKHWHGKPLPEYWKIMCLLSM